jgi:hypothetical protein
MEELKIGDIVELYNPFYPSHQDAIFIKHGRDGGIIVVKKEDEIYYNSGRSFSTLGIAAKYWRIKISSGYIPFTYEDQNKFMLKCVRLKSLRYGITGILLTTITGCDEKYVYVMGRELYQALFDDYEFLDGTPCGKLK